MEGTNIFKVETDKFGSTLIQLGNYQAVIKAKMTPEEMAVILEQLTNYYTKTHDRYIELLIKFGEHLIELKRVQRLESEVLS